MGADPNDPIAAFSEYAADTWWVARHLTQLAGVTVIRGTDNSRPDTPTRVVQSWAGGFKRRAPTAQHDGVPGTGRPLVVRGIDSE